MPSLIDRVSRFARSPQGRNVMDRAQRLARDPKTKRRIEEARARLGRRGRPR
jgi:hypothetical protein